MLFRSGLTVPFGSLTRWPNDGPFRTATTFSALPLLDIKPTLAYKATENLSRVWGMGPSAAEQTRMAPSIWAAPVIMFLM